MRPVSCLMALCLTAMPSMAFAASSEWVATDGARLRLVAEDQPRGDGTIRGVLSIELEPGWKTYWKDPGDAGVPPQIDLSRATNLSGAELRFPVPSRFETDGVSWAGYEGATVDLPIIFTMADPSVFAAIDADIFLGVCKEVCIPFQARLSVAPSAPAAAALESNIIATAFAGLPPPATDEMRIKAFRQEGDELIGEATHPKGPGAQELYVVTPPGWKLGAPTVETSGDRPIFRIPIAERAAVAPGANITLDYVYRSGFLAVAGSAPIE